MKPAIFAILAACALSGSAASEFDFFETHIRPLFAQHCYACHDAESAETSGAGLLLAAVRRPSHQAQIAPDMQLSNTQVADLETWISKGAADPRGVDEALYGRTPHAGYHAPVQHP